MVIGLSDITIIHFDNEKIPIHHDTKAMEYGRKYEHEAKLESVLCVKIRECKLFIDNKDVVWE